MSSLCLRRLEYVSSQISHVTLKETQPPWSPTIDSTMGELYIWNPTLISVLEGNQQMVT